MWRRWRQWLCYRAVSLPCAGQRGAPARSNGLGRVYLTSNVKVSVTSVAGAPGDGASSLTTAVERELASRGVAVSGRVVIGAYRVQAVVALGQANSGQQSVHIEWTVTDPSGKKLGNIEQYDEAPEGLLNRAWGIVAQKAARGIVMLIPR